MSPRTEKQFEVIREEKMHLIMERALELFATDGYHNVSVGDIAKAAKISKGLMYNYFENKEALLVAIANKGVKEILSGFDFDHDGVLTQHELKLFIGLTFKTIKENRQFWRLYYMLYMQPDVYDIIKEEFKELQERIYNVANTFFIKRGYEDPFCEMHIMSALLEGISFVYVFIDNESAYPLEKLENFIYEKYSLNNAKIIK